MRSLLLLLSLALLFTSCKEVKENRSTEAKDIEEIKKVLDRQNQDWNRGNIDAFMVGYWENDSLMFVGKSGVTYGYKNTMANYKKGYPDTTAMGKLSFTFIDFKRLSPEYYQVTGKYHLTRTVGDASGHYTLLIRKINDKWTIIYDHSS